MLKRKLVKEKEWREITRNLQALNTTVAKATQFVREIEQGNLDVTLDNDDSSSELHSSLVSMRDRMKQFSLAEQERNWVNEGLARFVEILRSRDNDTLKRLSDSILQNLVTYLKANQGALFLINDDDEKNVFLELTACYAYDRKKYINKKIELGEGIVGQTVLEKVTRYMTDVPKDFIKITSGLGEALPRNVLVVPLKLDDQVFGVVEIASFNVLKPYQIEFVEKLGESIASTISGVRANDKTKALLQETQSQAEEMRTQEEEMRQNMEELSSTQEEMQRILNEVQRHERFTKGILDSSSDMIVTINRQYKVTNFNKSFFENFKRSGLHVENGFDITQLVASEHRARHIEKYQQAFSGRQVSLQERYVYEGIDQYVIFVFTPIRTDKDEIDSISIFAKDVTEITQIKNQVEDSERYIKDLLNVSSDPTMTIDRDYNLVIFNKNYQESFTKMGFPINVGFNVMNLFPDEVKPEKKKIFDRVFAGEVIEMTEHLTTGGLDHYFNTKHAPLFDRDGKVTTIAIIARDITDITKARNLAQQQNEELKAQEEELRQNMEELAATQDEMNRVLMEVQRNEAFVTGLINASRDSIVTLDKDFRILNFNDTFKSSYTGLDVSIEKGLPLSRLARSKADAEKYEANYKRAFGGEAFSLTQQYSFGNITAYYDVNYVPMRDAEGNVYAIAIFSRDITELTVAQQKAAELLRESQQQTEELKAQEEELRQNMEELAATQEGMNRVLTEVQRNEAFVTGLINASRDSIVTLDKDLRILNFNDAFKANSDGLNVSIEKGLPLSKLAPSKADADKYEASCKRAFAGESFRTTQQYSFGNITAYFEVDYAPMRDAEGKVYAIAIFSRDVTELTLAQQKATELLRESQQLQKKK